MILGEPGQEIKEKTAPGAQVAVAFRLRRPGTFPFFSNGIDN